MKKEIKKIVKYCCNLNNMTEIKIREIVKQEESYPKFIALKYYRELQHKTMNMLRIMESLGLIYGTRIRWYTNKKKEIKDLIKKTHPRRRRSND